MSINQRGPARLPNHELIEVEFLILIERLSRGAID
jgi:hypothetical protein